MGTKKPVDHDLLSSFAEDASEALQTFERSLLKLRAGPDAEALEDLFRTAHNLKGASMCINLEEFGDLIHKVEDVIQSIINRSLDFEPYVASSLLRAHAFMVSWLEGLRSDPNFLPPFEEMKAELGALAKGTKQASPVEADIAQENQKSGSSSPDPEDLEALFNKHKRMYQERQKAQQAVATQCEAIEVEKASDPNSKDDKATPRQRQGQKSGSARASETLRISAQKLDELVQLVSELSIHHGIIHEGRRAEGFASKSTARALQLSHKLVREIHYKALELRMQPLTSLMQKLERTVADLATMQGKRIKVIMEGAEVQLDKSVIEKISDPLVHVIRNSVDHGVEDPNKRIASGKSAEATIKIVALQDSAGVSISVSDDGQGMDEREIFAAAVRKGLIEADAEMTPDQIRRLIFVQGLSTAQKLTEISGRGVGMDVVLRTVQSLRGRIDIDSTLGQGTTISLNLPTSMSIIDALVVKINDARYVVPMLEMTEIIDLSSYTIERSGQAGFMISLRGEVVPIEPLADYMPDREASTSSDASPLIEQSKERPALLVRDGARSIAFVIDRVVSQQQIVVRPLIEQLDGLQGFRGCTILGDGEPGVILSLPELAKLYFDSVGVGSEMV